MDWINYLILFGSAFAGGMIAIMIRNPKKMNLNLMLTFSGAYLFGITVMHLIPEVSHHSEPLTGVYVLAGFLLQLILEQFSKGLEHGHIHPPDQAGSPYLFSIFIGLSIHAFLEGIPMASQFHIEDARSPLLYGIALHKAPAAFALVSVFLAVKKNRNMAIVLLLLFSLMSPLGAWLFDIPNHSNVGHTHDHNHGEFNIIIAIVVGSFLHISTTILFESGTKMHSISWYKALAILVGAGFAFLTIW